MDKHTHEFTSHVHGFLHVRAEWEEDESNDRGGAGSRGWDPQHPGHVDPPPEQEQRLPDGRQVAAHGPRNWDHTSLGRLWKGLEPRRWDDTLGSGWDSWQRGGIRLLERRRTCASVVHT